MDLPKISDSELEVMKIIWKNAPINTNEVVKKLSESSDWNEKTIHTLLKRLVQKGAVQHDKEGRVFVYTPNVAEEDYIANQSKSFLKQYYDGTLGSMVQSFLEKDELSDSQVDELYQMLKERKGKE